MSELRQTLGRVLREHEMVDDQVDAVLRALAEHGDTQQVREEIAQALSRCAIQNGFRLRDLREPFADAVMAVVGPLIAYWRNRAENAERAEADLAVARQQLEQVRALTPRFCAHDSYGEPIGDAVAINDLLAILDVPETSTEDQSPPIRPTIPRDLLGAPARPAGHDESGQ